MIRSLIPVVALTLVIFTPALYGGKTKTRNWQTGKLLDAKRSQVFVGTVNRPGAVINGQRITNDSKQAVYAIQDTFVIEAETLTYTVSETLGRGAKPANLTIKGPVKFAVEDTTVYLLDEAGKEHRTEIVKKELRTQESPPVPK
ncbi:MAG: hypothetical protein ABSC23_13725 [Bryobacteraceae bacterium]|jgi:hypothetical protein